MKKETMNKYRILYRSEKFAHSARVFILATNDTHAQQIVMNAYNVPKQWITHVSLWKKNVDVIVSGENTWVA
jgi:formiminotetrahydrofolate cyclodeaminase